MGYLPMCPIRGLGYIQVTSKLLGKILHWRVHETTPHAANTFTIWQLQTKIALQTPDKKIPQNAHKILQTRMQLYFSSNSRRKKHIPANCSELLLAKCCTVKLQWPMCLPRWAQLILMNWSVESKHTRCLVVETHGKTPDIGTVQKPWHMKTSCFAGWILGSFLWPSQAQNALEMTSELQGVIYLDKGEPKNIQKPDFRSQNENIEKYL